MFMSKDEFVKPEQLKYHNRLIDYDDEQMPFCCFICNDKKEHLNSSIKVLPEHITQNIVFFLGCKHCEKFFELLDIDEERIALRKQRKKTDERLKLEFKSDRISHELDAVCDEHDHNNFVY